MQEEVTQKTIALSMKTGKLTAQALQAALKKYLQHRAKGPKLHHGRQKMQRSTARVRNTALPGGAPPRTSPRTSTPSLKTTSC